MNPAKLGKLGPKPSEPQLSGFCCFGNKPSKPNWNPVFNVLMNPTKSKLCFWIQVALRLGGFQNPGNLG